jgi:hypothetical protein
VSYFNVHVYKLTLEEHCIHIARAVGLREAERNEQGTLGYEIKPCSGIDPSIAHKFSDHFEYAGTFVTFGILISLFLCQRQRLQNGFRS